MYKNYWDKLLFEYKLIHSKRIKNIYSDVPYFMEKEIYSEFINTAKVINDIAVKIQNGINSEFQDFKNYIPPFKYINEILSLRREEIPIFWSRFDGFIREDINEKKVFYSELNYDKPCAQRECMVAEETLKGYGNINEGFLEKFINNFYKIKDKYYKSSRIKVALLVDPAHYEETHLALLFIEKLRNKDIELILSSAENIYVDNGEVFCFQEKIDVILRLYPTEYLYEIPDFLDILKLFDQGKILILNDPRVIIAQCKNLYTYLWVLVENKDTRLNDRERKAVINSLPYTEILTDENLTEASRNKDKYVIKPVYGRYSDDVFIGKLYSEEEWKEVIDYIKISKFEKPYIIQEFIKQKQETTYYYDGEFRIPKDGYGNFGIYFSLDEVIGTCVRWNPDYLTNDEYTWFTPIGIEEEKFRITPEYFKLKDIDSRIIVEGEFSGLNIWNKEYINTSIGVLDENKLNELKYATEELSKIFIKTRDYIKQNIDVFKDILSIDGLEKVIKKDECEELTFLGRMDWALDSYNNWKLLEFNSETPAGVAEAIFVEEILFDEIEKRTSNLKDVRRINEKLKDMIFQEGKKIIDSYDLDNPTIGFISLTYYEDWVNTNAIYKIFKEKYNCVCGNIEDMEIRIDGLYLYNEKVDVVFRYYPLDWMKDEEDIECNKLLEIASEKVFFLNPANTIITQSKALFPIIFQLIKNKFYTSREEEIIRSYIPHTTFDIEELVSNDFFIKPLLGREGTKVVPSYKLREIPDEDIVFQQSVLTKTCGDKKYVIFGTYVTGSNFAGVYTRLGEEVTTKECSYIPLTTKVL
ncbi:glutathionylspermidine synthase family protein [Clostridium sp. 'White wine YQ']|uniref:glutathionylspermidine synthase family protein n=1 Tax=Clostridium sp. 'White wine YQ' TaxID=3027474 RepID=UPI002366B672|nr:glutathionylspermidine synthase family protein [Clostridium sp. 'White wine YQ']MDD7794798.1 glutathionylspermidine synthase family protein [Clostridium sp. 'White wine YQ']